MNNLRCGRGLSWTYIAESESGLLKIGKTSNIPERMLQHESGSGFKILRVAHITEPIPEKHARLYELALLGLYRIERQKGEWVDVNFNTAVESLKRLSESEVEIEDYSSVKEKQTEYWLKRNGYIKEYRNKQKRRFFLKKDEDMWCLDRITQGNCVHIAKFPAEEIIDYIEENGYTLVRKLTD